MIRLNYNFYDYYKDGNDIIGIVEKVEELLLEVEKYSQLGDIDQQQLQNYIDLGIEMIDDIRLLDDETEGSDSLDMGYLINNYQETKELKNELKTTVHDIGKENALYIDSLDKNSIYGRKALKMIGKMFVDTKVNRVKVGNFDKLVIYHDK